MSSLFSFIRLIFFYQNFTYNAAITSNVITIITIVEGFSLNISLSSSNALGFIFGPVRLINTMTIMVNMNARPIQMWKGISKPPFPFG